MRNMTTAWPADLPLFTDADATTTEPNESPEDPETFAELLVEPVV
jgi:hypothetical protein